MISITCVSAMIAGGIKVSVALEDQDLVLT